MEQSKFSLKDLEEDQFMLAHFESLLDKKVCDMIASGELSQEEIRELDREAAIELNKQNKAIGRGKKVPKSIILANKAAEPKKPDVNKLINQRKVKAANRAKRKSSKRK